jgi:hypothetical protein
MMADGMWRLSPIGSTLIARWRQRCGLSAVILATLHLVPAAAERAWPRQSTTTDTIESRCPRPHPFFCMMAAPNPVRTFMRL